MPNTYRGGVADVAVYSIFSSVGFVVRSIPNTLFLVSLDALGFSNFVYTRSAMVVRLAHLPNVHRLSVASYIRC